MCARRDPTKLPKRPSLANARPALPPHLLDGFIGHLPGGRPKVGLGRVGPASMARLRLSMFALHDECHENMRWGPSSELLMLFERQLASGGCPCARLVSSCPWGWRLVGSAPCTKSRVRYAPCTMRREGTRCWAHLVGDCPYKTGALWEVHAPSLVRFPPCPTRSEWGPACCTIGQRCARCLLRCMMCGPGHPSVYPSESLHRPCLSVWALPVSVWTLPVSVGTLPVSVGTLPVSVGTLPVSVWTLPISVWTLPVCLNSACLFKLIIRVNRQPGRYAD